MTIFICIFAVLFCFACNRDDSSSGNGAGDTLKKNYRESVEEYERLLAEFNELEDRVLHSDNPSRRDRDLYSDGNLRERVNAAEREMRNAGTYLYSDRVGRMSSLKIDGSEYTYGELVDALNGTLSYDYDPESDVEYFYLELRLFEVFGSSINYEEQQRIAAKVWEFVLQQEDWECDWNEEWLASRQGEEIYSYDFAASRSSATLELYFIPNSDLSDVSYTKYPLGIDSDEVSGIMLGFEYERRFNRLWFTFYPESSHDDAIDGLLALIASEL